MQKSEGTVFFQQGGHSGGLPNGKSSSNLNLSNGLNTSKDGNDDLTGDKDFMESVLTSIANARAGLMTAKSPDEKLAANDRLNTAILPLMRLQESYPQLKSNDQFMRLQDELSGTENRIAVARRRYNGSIQDYNTFIQQFPNSLWAGFAGFHTRSEYYTADPGSKAAPKVDFGK